MIEILEYIFFGVIHFLVITLEFMDYIENSLIGLLVVFFVGIALWERKFIKMYLDIAKTFIKMILSSFGIILFGVMASYYCFTIIFFEEKISIIFIIITLCLFFKDLFEFMTNSIIDENKKTINSILEICKSIFILIFYRLIYMIELRNFSEFNYLLYSLIFIPVIALVIIMMKILTSVETLTAKFSKYEKLEDIEYLKLFLRTLLKVKSINNTNKIINDFFANNKKKTYKEVLQQMPIHKDSKKGKRIKEENNKLNVRSIWFIIWIANILNAVYIVIEKRFLNSNFSFSYYWTLFILSIYFIADLMKMYKIKCQYDFIIYLVIAIVEYLILIIYYFQIQDGRLSNMLFLVAVYIVFALLFRKNKRISFLNMPAISKENFFGLPPKDKI